MSSPKAPPWVNAPGKLAHPSRSRGVASQMDSIMLMVSILLAAIFPAAQLAQDTCDREGCDYELVRMFRQGCPTEHSDVKCALRKVEEIQNWLRRNNKFKILITGKMGTGKTTLIRGLKENFVPEEDTLLPHTVNVTLYKHLYEKIDITFLDTPGLKDEIDGSNDYTYLKDMVKNSQEPELLIFAVKMDDVDFRPEDKDAIKNITDAFGWKVWKNAMFVLTFANKVSKAGYSLNSAENKVHYNNVRDQFKIRVAEILRGLKVQEDVVNNVPVIPVGLVSELLIPSDGRQVSWVTEFWTTVFNVLKASRQPVSGTSIHRESELLNAKVGVESSSPLNDSKSSLLIAVTGVTSIFLLVALVCRVNAICFILLGCLCLLFYLSIL